MPKFIPINKKIELVNSIHKLEDGSPSIDVTNAPPNINVNSIFEAKCFVHYVLLYRHSC
jgi:hypothetical protein